MQPSAIPNPLPARHDPPVGGLLRDWRLRRRRSQMDLALDAGVSTRHLSCIETGRARPGAATLLALAQCLDVPLRERNALLLAAGYAPRYPERALGADDMARVRGALQRLLAAHDPMPGLVLDRQWNVVMANAGAARLVDLLPSHLAGPPLNVFRASLHPEGLARLTGNLAEWGALLVGALRRAVQRTADPRWRRCWRKSWPTRRCSPSRSPRAGRRRIRCICWCPACWIFPPAGSACSRR